MDNDIVSKLIDGNLISTNLLITTFIGLYGLTLVTIIFKDIPNKIVGFLMKQITTVVQISNMDGCFYTLMELFEKENIVEKSRHIKFINGRWGRSNKIIKSIGSGKHVFFFRNVPIFVQYEMIQSTLSTDEKLRIYLTKFGRSHKLFDELRQDLEKFSETGYDSENKTIIFNYAKQRYWSELVTIDQRSFDTIFISKYIKETLINHLTRFYKSREWYKNRGIPYQTGIILYGEPGSGKTSIIKGLASYFKKKLCILSASRIIELPDALQTIPENGFIVVEDIDTSVIVKDRGIDVDAVAPDPVSKIAEEIDDVPITTRSSKGNDKNTKIENKVAEYAQQYLAEVLNAIDGIVSIDERVIIFTTNNIETIDKALLRPGRIDVSLYVGYIDKEAFIKFIRVFYEEKVTEEINGLLKKISNIRKITVATLQNEFISGVAVEEMIKKWALF
jgi:chaperone BCS1